ncbi:MAG: DEAD/DEAH box helicase family protein [Prevotella sp.]|nr:DEAD/DEAH box helicase family protein [Prevotella sp.]
MDNWLQIMSDGQVGRSLTALPKGMTSVPLLRSLGLRREQRKKYGERNRQLRIYQTELLGGLEKSFRHSKRVLLQLPSGAGKAFVVSKVIRQEWGRRHARNRYWEDEVLFVAHRVEVMRQVSQILERYGLPHAVIDSQYSGPYGYGDLTLLAAPDVPLFLSKVNKHLSPAMVIIDEVHTVGSALCEMLRRRFPDSRLLGLSATPCVEGGKPLSKVFGKLLPSWSVRRLIAGGWLRDVDVEVVPDGTGNVEKLYEAYKDSVEGKKGIVFASDDLHAKHIVDCYRRHGVRCELTGFGDSAEVQEQTLNEFEAGLLTVLVCVGYFSEGMRCPDVDFVQLADNTDSLSVYLHQVGCAMRPGRDEEYGEDGMTVELRRLTALDHAGLSVRFGLPTDERDWKQLFATRFQ